MNIKRQILLDTETTGLSPKDGHRIVEIGCVELVDRRLTNNNFHTYLNPERKMDKEAFAVHGLGDDFLSDKPLFKDIAASFIDYIQGAELIIHNAPFDLGFLDHELSKQKLGKISKYCTVLDTLVLARKMHMGQRNTLDALCKRYSIDNTNRQLHGALLDASLLAGVYLAMTGGQISLFVTEDMPMEQQRVMAHKIERGSPTRVISATKEELAAHKKQLDAMKAKGKCVWVDET